MDEDFAVEIDSIQWEQFGKYGGRKHEGRLSLLADAVEEKFYLMPLNMEHIAYATLLSPAPNPGPQDLQRYIPVHIFVEDIGEKIADTQRCVVGLMTGESGMEQGFGVRHTMKDMQWARTKTLEMIAQGEIPLSPNGLKEDKIAHRYSLENGNRKDHH